MATKPRRRSPSLSSSSSSTSYSRSPASPSSFSSSPSRSRSPPRPARRGRSPSLPPPPSPPPPRKASPPPESTVLHVDHLSRNVNEDHLKEIFGQLPSFLPKSFSTVVKFCALYTKCVVAVVCKVIIFSVLTSSLLKSLNLYTFFLDKTNARVYAGLYFTQQMPHVPKPWLRAWDPGAISVLVFTFHTIGTVPAVIELNYTQQHCCFFSSYRRCFAENYGEVINVELSMDRVVNLPRGYGYVEFKNRADAEKALLYLDGGQIDGNVVKVRFAFPPQQRAAASPKALRPPPKGDVIDYNKVGPSAEKATKQQPREPYHQEEIGAVQSAGAPHCLVEGWTKKGAQKSQS
uniref:RRM domain-containing protein n=1 Tax=Oryza punctata TaxID=4537 RepID=A0A0E0KXJ1_ORYPU